MDHHNLRCRTPSYHIASLEEETFTAWIEHDRPVPAASVAVLWLTTTTTSSNNSRCQCIIKRPTDFCKVPSQEDHEMTVSDCITAMESALTTSSLNSSTTNVHLTTATPYHMTLSMVLNPNSIQMEFPLYKMAFDPSFEPPVASAEVIPSTLARMELGRLEIQPSCLGNTQSWTMRGLPRRAPELHYVPFVVADRFVHPNAALFAPITSRRKAPSVFISLMSMENVSLHDFFNWERTAGHADTTCIETIVNGIQVLEKGLYQVDIEVHCLPTMHNHDKVFRVYLAGKSLDEFMTVHRHKVASEKRKRLKIVSTRMTLLCEPYEDIKVQYLMRSYAFRTTRMSIRKLSS